MKQIDYTHVLAFVFGIIDAFEGQFYPSDQTPTGHDRWEWKLKDGITREIFLEKVKAYAKLNFKLNFKTSSFSYASNSKTLNGTMT